MGALPIRNEGWGFAGTMAGLGDTGAAWEIASAVLLRATGGTPEGVRGFLDSRQGRHFADEVASGLGRGLDLAAAIDAAAARWMGWRIGRRTAREEGIPIGLPLLTGWVLHHGILDEMAG